mmetsp:Transcript_1742/g.10739  ORF Transcript_1742/g.10739 Transcript_1742/m.10739 type:complete len:202 (-) Transcript_1742:2407-3012(-)
MLTEAEAIRRLDDAGDDIGRLVECIHEAEFLAQKPGESRQKLRAAKARLRGLKIKENNEEKASLEKKKKTQPGLDLANSLQDLDKQEPSAVYNYALFQELSEQYKNLKWRKIQLPGGATRFPEEYYVLYALAMQATKGNNTGEEPMWAETGGLDFEGRLQWAAWNTRKGADANWCKKKFVQAYFEMDSKVMFMDNRIKPQE